MRAPIGGYAPSLAWQLVSPHNLHSHLALARVQVGVWGKEAKPPVPPQSSQRIGKALTGLSVTFEYRVSGPFQRKGPINLEYFSAGAEKYVYVITGPCGPLVSGAEHPLTPAEGFMPAAGSQML